MLKINLLPPEKRKLEKTPLPRFLLIIAVVVAFLGVSIVCTYLWIQIGNKEDQIALLEKNLKELEADVKKFEALSVELTTLEEQKKQIESVVSRPIRWSELIDTVWDIVVSNKRIWLEELKITDAGGASGELKKFMPGTKSPAEMGVVLKCNALGTDLDAMTNFRKDLKTNPKLSSLFNIVNIDPDYKIEADSIKFTVSLIRAAVEEK